METNNANTLALRKAEANARNKETLELCKKRDILLKEFFTAYQDYNRRLQEFEANVYDRLKTEMKDQDEYEQFRKLQVQFSDERNRLKEDKFKPFFEVYEEIKNAEGTFDLVRNELNALERLPTQPNVKPVNMYPKFMQKMRRASLPSFPGKGLLSRLTKTIRGRQQEEKEERKRSQSAGAKRNRRNKTQKRKH